MREGPPRPAFKAESERDLIAWSELWEYCRDISQTPAEALEDPELPFNVSVMRAYKATRRYKLSLVYQGLGKDEFGTDRMLNTVKMIYEDS